MNLDFPKKSDSQLAKLLAKARDYAQIYVLARQRQKGCDGFGEMTNLKEEFSDVVDKVIQYSHEKIYISQDISDIDTIADEIVKGQQPSTGKDDKKANH